MLLGTRQKLSAAGTTMMNEGEYYPRIYRPTICEPPNSPPVDRRRINDAERQLEILWREVSSIFEVVYPSEHNIHTYGDKIRNIIILCATEVETQFKGILAANELEGRNIVDYMRLEPHLRLSGWAVGLRWNPDLSARRPFAIDDGQPSPTWWRAYNRIKHDREGNINDASLGVMIDSFCAVVIILSAQYEIIGRRWAMVTQPIFPPDECYRNDPFGDWTAISLIIS